MGYPLNICLHIKIAQFLKPLALLLCLTPNLGMAKKVYHLTIEYDSTKDEIEYICEEVQDEASGEVIQLMQLDMNDFFDEDVMDILIQYGYFGEA